MITYPEQYSFNELIRIEDYLYSLNPKFFVPKKIFTNVDNIIDLSLFEDKKTLKMALSILSKQPEIIIEWIRNHYSPAFLFKENTSISNNRNKYEKDTFIAQIFKLFSYHIASDFLDVPLVNFHYSLSPLAKILGVTVNKSAEFYVKILMIYSRSKVKIKINGN